MAYSQPASYLNTVARTAGAPGDAAQARFATLTDTGRMSAHGFVHDVGHANAGMTRFASDMGAIGAMTPTYYGANKYAHIDERNVVYKTEGQTFADVHHLQTAFLESIVCILAKDDFVGTRMYPLVPIDSMINEISLRITTYNPGVALPTPDLGIPTMLSERTTVLTGGLKRHAIGQVQGMWYGMTEEAMKAAAPRMKQLHGSFNSARLLRCYDEIYRHASPESIYKQFGIMYDSQDPVEAFRRLQIAAAHQFGMCAKDVQTAGMSLRKFLDDVLTERRCRLSAILAPPAFANFGIDSAALSNPMVTSQHRIDATYNGSEGPMEPVTRGIEVGVAYPIPTSATTSEYPLIHVATVGVHNPIGDPRIIDACPPEYFRSFLMDARVRCHENDTLVTIHYIDVLRNSGLFGVDKKFGAAGSVTGQGYLKALGERVTKDPPTFGDLVRYNQLESYFEALFPVKVDESTAVGGYFGTKRQRFTPTALNTTLKGTSVPTDVKDPKGRSVVSFDVIMGIQLTAMTLATFELMHASDIPIPIPFILFRPSIVSEMGHVIGMDLGEGTDDPGIGRAAQTPEITTNHTTLRQLTTNNIVAHIGVITTHPERLVTAYNVIPVRSVGGGRASVADLSNPDTVAAFRTHLSSAGRASRSSEVDLPHAMLPIPVFARELTSILASHVFTVSPHVGSQDKTAYANGTPLPLKNVHKITCAMAPVIYNRFYTKVGVMSREDAERANFSHTGRFNLNATSTAGLTVRPTAQPGGSFAFTDVLADEIWGGNTDDGTLRRFYGGGGISTSRTLYSAV